MAGELDPRTRKEVFLAGMLYGDPEDLPDPETRDELYMKAIGEAIKAGGLPDPSEASEGDVLAIGADGPEWAAPSGKTLYQHNIFIIGDDGPKSVHYSITIINDSDTPFTKNTLWTYLNEKGYSEAEYSYTNVAGFASYSYNGTVWIQPLSYIFADTFSDNPYLRFVGLRVTFNFSGSSSTATNSSDNWTINSTAINYNFTDTVKLL